MGRASFDNSGKFRGYSENNEPATLSGDTVITCDGCPPVDAVLNESQTGWRPPTESEQLPAAKTAKCAAIDTRTSAIIAAGFTFDGSSFSLSLEAQSRWLALFGKFSASQLTDNFAISTADDGSYTLTLAKAQSFFDAAFAAVETPVASGRALKIAANACTTLAELEQVTDER